MTIPIKSTKRPKKAKKDNPLPTPEFNVELVKQYVLHFEKFQGAYFFTSPLQASARRNYEKYYSLGTYSFDYIGDSYELSFNIDCSCKHVYVNKYVYKNGEKTNITVIKTLLNKIASFLKHDN